MTYFKILPVDYTRNILEELNYTVRVVIIPSEVSLGTLLIVAKRTSWGSQRSQTLN